ncbi:hypothetical protein BOTBODRAFT_59940 [Botryobasidium botryosum FD-172 SS1]|uniref:Uncharacterized protein n=1 Tax=Botryobasidium botryosum (strain FD-172 SS1) TaxID=930990 RepID=A0A067LVZ8_BOTB1|nr:hypothetical protein BOTBODRAFT_59940 [Botryobasidium botryosum FD-172 SS1]
MPAVYTIKGEFLHYECDHQHCSRKTRHPDATRSAYAWCKDHAEEVARVNFDALDTAYIDERERLRTTPLAYYPNGALRASRLGPCEAHIPLSSERDLFVLQTWRDSTDHLYNQIARPIRQRVDHSTLFYRGDSHAGHDRDFTLFIQEQAKLLSQLTELDAIIAQRRRY